MFRQILTICKKELMDTIQDRRSLFAMIFIPALLMPLLIIGMTRSNRLSNKKSQEQVVKSRLAAKTTPSSV